MKIHIISDIHLECNQGRYPYLEQLPDADMCILAGDVCSARNLKLLPNLYANFFNTINKKYSRTLYIPGNHEYYNSDMPEAIVSIQDYLSKYANITFGHRFVHTVNETKFICATLWTNFGDGDPICEFDAARFISDFRRIKNGSNLITTEEMKCFYKEDLAFIHRELTVQDRTKKIVVTHFSPSTMLCQQKWWNSNSSSLNKYFHNEVSPDIIEMADTWICGHTHDPAMMYFNETQLICNPHGYPEEQDTFEENECKFDPSLVIEI